MTRGRDIRVKHVFYQRNVDLGLEAECYECTSHRKDVGGYVHVGREGKDWPLHRYVWYTYTGELPEMVMHKCDNRSCCRIEHLMAGDAATNVLDMRLKGRASFRGKRREMSEADVIELRELRAEGLKYSSLSRIFGISTGTVGDIIKGHIYKDVGGPLS